MHTLPAASRHDVNSCSCPYVWALQPPSEGFQQECPAGLQFSPTPHCPACSDISRQEYLKKREEAKLEELKEALEDEKYLFQARGVACSVC